MLDNHSITEKLAEVVIHAFLDIEYSLCDAGLRLFIKPQLTACILVSRFIRACFFSVIVDLRNNVECCGLFGENRVFFSTVA